MSQKTYRSTRIKKRDLSSQTIDKISLMMYQYQQVKRCAYRQLVIAARHPDIEKAIRDGLYKKMRSKYDMNQYCLTSALIEAKAMIKSQRELRHMYIQNTRAKISAIDNKIDKTKQKLQVFYDIKNAFKTNSMPKLDGRRFKIVDDTHIAVLHGFGKKDKDKKFNLYDFEHVWLDKQIKTFRARVGNLKFKRDRLNDKLNRLLNKTYFPAAVFGGRRNAIRLSRIMNTKYDEKTKSRFLKQYRDARSSSFGVSGVSSSLNGNYVFIYNYITHELTIRDRGTNVILSNVTFPYGQDQIDRYYTEHTEQHIAYSKERGAYRKVRNAELAECQQRDGARWSNKKLENSPICESEPIAFRIVDRGDYYIVQCSLNAHFGEVNYSKADGILGVDTNLGFISVANIDAHGNCLETEDICYDNSGCSGYNNKQIELAAITSVRKAVKSHKPISLENLDVKQSTKIAAYNNPKCNIAKSVFASKKMISAIKSCAEKYGVDVIEVNPAYTSFIGEKKFMPVYKRSRHQMAAFTIGRRALGIEESIPKRYKADTWPALYKELKKKA